MVEIILISVLAAALIVLAVRHVTLRQESAQLTEDLNDSIEANVELRKYVNELLKTRRRETRQRFLGLIEEHKARD